jgi:hypothetical protein
MRRSLLVAAIAASLLNPGTSATLADSLWYLLSSAWAAADAGCGADPDGRCQPAPAPQIDEGCIGDPNGGCRPAPAPRIDAGCIGDPNGCPSGS